MNDILKKLLLFLLILLVIGGFVLYKYNDNKISFIEEKDIKDLINEHSYVMIYFGDESDKITKMLKSFKSEFLIKGFYLPTNAEDVTEILGQDVESNDIYALFIDGGFSAVIDSDDEDRIRELIRKYLYGEIPEDERNFKVLSTADEYIKKLNSKEYTVAVFGEKKCSYCTLYLPIINEIAGEYELDIYYFDKSTYDVEEYEQIMDLDLTIPGECTMNGSSTTFLKGFPKPMTLITKKGEIVGCIRGYVVKEQVVSKLKEFNIIKEK